MPQRPLHKCGPEEFVEFLNELYALDPEWVQELINFRPTCNVAIGNHPSVQASCGPVTMGHVQFPSIRIFKAGILGLLNGFYGTFDDPPNKGCGFIAATVDDDDLSKVRGFQMFDRKEATK